jgi:Intrinsic membrane protein PufX
MPNDYTQESRTTQLMFWGFGQMMKGAIMAAAFVVLIGLAVWAIYLLGLLLPEESRQTPSPYAAVEMQVVVEAHGLA